MKVYKIIEAGIIEDLEQEVNEAIKSGFMPLGGVAQIPVQVGTKVGFLLAQAVMREVEE